MVFLFIVPRFHTNLRGWVSSLQEKGHTVHILASFRGPTEDHSLLKPAIHKQSLLSKFICSTLGDGGGDRANLFPRIYDLFSAFHCIKPDFVIIRNPKRKASLLALIVAKMYKSKVVFYTQSRFDEWSTFKINTLAFFLKCLDAAWLSPLMNEISEKYCKKRFFFSPFAVAAPRSFIRHDRKSTRLLMIGKYGAKRKNHEVFLQAIALLNRNDVEAWVVGESNDAPSKERLEYLKNFSCELGIRDRVEFFENVIPHEMVAFYLSSDLFVLPSRDEPAAISVLEALAHGLPAICSSTCGTKTYINPGVNGHVFRSEDPGTLKQVIEEITRDPATFARFKSSALGSARSFTPNQFYKNFSSIAKRLWGVSIQEPES